MKKLFILMTSMLAAGCAVAADTTDCGQLLRMRKMWLYKTTKSTADGLQTGMQTETAVIDTVIDGITCRRTLIGLPIPPAGLPTPPIDMIDDSTSSNVKGVYFEVVYREDNGKIYFYSKEQKKFFLIMDFNLEQGDKLERQLTDGTVMTLECVRKDKIETGNDVRRRLVMGNDEVWVEGIGGERPLYEYVAAPDSPRAEFRGFFDFGRLVFGPKDFDAPAID